MPESHKNWLILRALISDKYQSRISSVGKSGVPSEFSNIWIRVWWQLWSCVARLLSDKCGQTTCVFLWWQPKWHPVFPILSPPRHPVQPQLHSAVRGPGRSDEGHPRGQEHEGADPERAAPPTAAAAAVGTPEPGGQTVGPQQHEPQQRQQG